jgi:F-type H+-transporting ATPase subunit b
MELNPLKMIDFRVIAVVIAIFTVTHFVLRRTFFLPVIEMMERRRERIDAGDAKRDEAADVSRLAEDEAESIIARGRDRAERVAQAIRERTQTVRREQLDGARGESAALMEKGRLGIAQEREAELTKLRSETATCVTLACERLLGGADGETIDGIVDRLVARRVH